MNYIYSFLIHETLWLLLDALGINFIVFKILIVVSFVSTSLILFLGKNLKIKPYKYIICLGHKLNNDQMDLNLINRLNKTLLLKKQDTIIILTGGITKGNSVSEAHVMNHYLQSRKTNNTILIEDESKTTVENIENIVKKYPEIVNENVLIVSNEYHLFRAKLICHRHGLKNVQAAGCISLPTSFIKQMLIEKYCLLTGKF